MRALVLTLIVIFACNCDDDESPKCPTRKGGRMDLGQRWIDEGFVRECVTFENGTSIGVRSAIVACLSNYYQEIPVDTEMTFRGKTYKCDKDPETGGVQLTQMH
ncbi:hypothetical protein ANCCAN_23903 [Ancylostoma caninum]|uniref:Abnormal cell migration protein 18-like fibronectin type I domain-containing protein n=1 Tax=Ancylostoma caninum TaxID=29170 RepID=A0A368FHN5_ANCCA|nr:hypothetical protein ANCCAN_23903 [Ancylostoma caninum]